MANQKCPICNGARRIPWPAAGMLQDCDCVRLERGEPQVTGLLPPPPSDAWSLPPGWSWQRNSHHGHYALRLNPYGEVFEMAPGTGVTLVNGGAGEPTDEIRRLVTRRNFEDITRARGTGPRSP